MAASWLPRRTVSIRLAASMAASLTRCQEQPPRTPPLSWTFLSALGGSRTPNLLIRSQTLYPLGYERNMHSLGASR